MQKHPFTFPKIGIRPTIDGRLGGVRESLEDQTMAMAQRVADLYTRELRNLDGSPVECVIADSNIGGVREAAACEEKFQREGVGLSLTVTPCWCYGSETMDMDPTGRKLYGDSTAPSAPAQSIWRPFSQGTHKRAFQPLASMERMCRKPVTRRCRKMSLRSSSILPDDSP